MNPYEIISITIVILFGSILEKFGFLNDVFIETAVEVNYRVALPIIILWGIIDNQASLEFINLYWGQLFLTHIFLLCVFAIFQWSTKKIHLRSKESLKVLVKVFLPFALSLIAHFNGPNIFNGICVIGVVVIPAINLALKIDLKVIPMSWSDLWMGTHLYVRKILFHPVVIAGCLGAFLWKEDFGLKSSFVYTVDFVSVAILPFCLIIFGAKMSQGLDQLKDLLSKPL